MKEEKENMADTISTLLVCLFRYYSAGNSKNKTPSTDGESAFPGFMSSSGKAINVLSKLGPAVKIGILTLPGVKFYLNSLSDGIIINHSGVYEIDLRDTTTTISSLTFEPESLWRIHNSDNGSLIIDIMYKGDGE